LDEARAPNYELAEKDYMSGMKYKDIAIKYNVSLSTVKSWKTRYKWNKKGMRTKVEKVRVQKKNAKPIDDGTRETMLNENLTHEQRLFCIYYSKSFNAAQSYQKAYGCTYDAARVEGCRHLTKPNVRAEIQRLQEIKRQQITITEADMVEFHMRIVFADMGDFARVKKGMVFLSDTDNVDTQLIKEVKQTADGVGIKLLDRCKSMDWLDRYFMFNPLDRHKIEYDKRKLELDLIKLDYEAKKNEPQTVETGTDNFLDALNSKATEVWKDE
jgi:phage terminase small subunit